MCESHRSLGSRQEVRVPVEQKNYRVEAPSAHVEERLIEEARTVANAITTSPTGRHDVKTTPAPEKSAPAKASRPPMTDPDRTQKPVLKMEAPAASKASPTPKAPPLAPPPVPVVPVQAGQREVTGQMVTEIVTILIKLRFALQDIPAFQARNRSALIAKAKKDICGALGLQSDRYFVQELKQIVKIDPITSDFVNSVKW